MGGGLMQLVAYGAQDIYLTGNPQITFFKVVYRRHTNFSMESIQQTWNGTSVNGDSRCTSTISRNGDLVHKMYLELEGTVSASYTHNPGALVIDTIEVEVGGQLIDRHNGTWLEVWSELTEKPAQLDYVPGPDSLVTAHGFEGPPFQSMAIAGGTNAASAKKTLLASHWVPLRFWFCNNPGNALPLIALQYHEVRIINDDEVIATILDPDDIKSL